MAEIQNSKVKILDCTLRDGGYCNNWQFQKRDAGAIVSALNNAGVDIIELGYKSPKSHTSTFFEGLFRYCTESQLQLLVENTTSEYAFMVDAKEFLKNDTVVRSEVEDCIPICEESLFDWVRIASYHSTLQGTGELTDVLHDLGYRVTINLMGTSLLPEDDLHRAFSLASTAKMDVLYFSDSFGDLQPNDIYNCTNVIRKYHSGKIGIHTHDNNGLAFANTIAAIDAGVDYIDATLMGMGRGAGNLRTEQILLYLYFKLHKKSVNPSELLDVMDSVMIPLHKTYQWGWDYTYMLSAMQSIHPTYCQHLRATNQYTIGQVNGILHCIDPSQREKYNGGALLKAIDSVVNRPVQYDEKLMDLPLYEPLDGDTFLVIATGPSVDSYSDEIIEFIKQKSPVVIECNPKNTLFESQSPIYIKAILNWVRLQKTLESPALSKTPIIAGLKAIPEKYSYANVRTIPCHISKGNVQIHRIGITLPAYVVGMFAVGLALLSKPKIVYLAGFDGYSDERNPKHQEMNVFWKETSSSPLVSITPTTYPLVIEPVYRLIK